jgi:hypothetical protein
LGRGDLSRLAALLVVVLACASAALAAGASHLITFTLVGATEPTGTQAPQAYFALRKSDTAHWVGRLTAGQRARFAAVDYTRSVVFAGFLDGHACASDVRLNGLVHEGRRLIVTVTYKRPPIGVATCVRKSIRYVVLALDRSGLGHVPTQVELRANARA